MSLSKLIRSTQEYAEICDYCKDECIMFGKTFTQEDVEYETLQTILFRYKALKDNCNSENEYLYKRLLTDILELFNLSQYNLLEDQNEIITELKLIKEIYENSNKKDI